MTWKWTWKLKLKLRTGCRRRKDGQQREKACEGLGGRACLVEEVAVAELGRRLKRERMRG